jgi:excisionase family DNA binding protein
MKDQPPAVSRGRHVHSLVRRRYAIDLDILSGNEIYRRTPEFWRLCERRGARYNNAMAHITSGHGKRDSTSPDLPIGPSFPKQQNGGTVKVPIGDVLPMPACSLKHMPTEPAASKALLSVKEVAQHLNVSVQTVRHLQRQRRVPFIKIGGCVRFASDDVRAYLNKQRVDFIG